MSFFYDLVLFLYLLFSLPKFLKKKNGPKKYALSLRELLGIDFPTFSPDEKVIWLHAVSVGEVKVAATLLPFLQKEYPGRRFLVTSATKTGLEKAKSVFPAGTSCAILPFDFSFLMKRLLRRIQVEMLFVSESDFWYHFLRFSKQQGTKIFLINGKLSQRSFSRYQYCPWFAKALFGTFEKILVQNEEYYKRFRALLPDATLQITGNMKYDVQIEIPSAEVQSAITFGSTHIEEEEILLEVVKKFHVEFPQQKIYLVPRHPERFIPFGEKCKEQGIPFSYFSKGKESSVVLVDVMGKLVSLYAASKICVVAGSFHPMLQGHDIFEPILVKSIPIFGPNMNSQKEMVSLVLENRAGVQCEAGELYSTICNMMGAAIWNEYQANGQTLLSGLKGSVQRTWLEIQKKEKSPLHFKCTVC